MSVLADLLSAHRQALLDRVAAAEGGRLAVLREALGGFLAEVEGALRGGAGEALEGATGRIRAAQGEARGQHGLGLDELVRAHGWLRDAIYDQLELAGVQPTVGEFRVLSACLSAAVAGPVRRLASELHGGIDAGRLHLLELFQQAPGFVAFLRGPTHVFEITNAAYEQLVGHRDVLGKTVRDALPELVGQGFYELLDRVYATAEPFVGRAVRIELQGEPGAPLVEAFLDFIYQPIRGSDGRVLGILVQGHDVTETRRQEAQRQAVEQALRASEERYRTLFESIDDGFCLMQMIVDGQGATVDYRFLETNAAFEGQTGLRDAVGKTARELVPTLDESWFRLYGGVADSGETARFENHAPAMGRWFDVYASRVGQPAQRLVALVFKDITARKKAEQQREQVLVQLAKSNESLDQFAYIASHDLKAPLRGIANLSEWIEDDLGDAVTDDARKKLGLLRGRVHHLERLIEGILSYSTAGRRKARPEPVDTGKLLTETVELLALPAGVTVSVGPMPTITAERVPLQQVFMNLIGNAVKHSLRPDAVVEVAARDEDDGAWHFTVSDNGPGIAPEHHERIWNIFQKLGGNVEGTGIGLSVVKRIVESRGGRVRVESPAGQGATFHVLWPKQAMESA